MSVCETSRCKYKVNHLNCTDLCCRGAEEDSCKILQVVNMLMTFEQLFSCGFRYFFSRINKNALLSDFDLEDDSTYKHAKDKSECNKGALSWYGKLTWESAHAWNLIILCLLIDLVITVIFMVHLSFYAIPLLIYDVMYDITTIPQGTQL